MLRAAGHIAESVNFLGWKGLQNGDLLVKVQVDYDLFLTRDKDFDEAALGRYVTPTFGIVLLAIPQQRGPAKDKFGKDRYYDPWFASLASVCGVDRAAIEQRDKRRQARNRWITIAIVSSVITALSVALTFAMISRNEAQFQRNEAERRRQLAESTAYVANMNLARSEFDNGNLPRGFDLLDTYLPQDKVRSLISAGPGQTGAVCLN